MKLWIIITIALFFALDLAVLIIATC